MSEWGDYKLEHEKSTVLKCEDVKIVVGGWKSEDCLVGVRDCYCATNGGMIKGFEGSTTVQTSTKGLVPMKTKDKGRLIPSYMLTVAKEYIRSFRQVQQGTLVGSRTRMDCNGKDLADLILRLADDE